MPLSKSCRISRELSRLVRTGRFLEQSDKQVSPSLPTQAPVSESDRCAAFIDQMLPQLPEILPQSADYRRALAGVPV
jgi:hypothetical protein